LSDERSSTTQLNGGCQNDRQKFIKWYAVS